MRKQTLWISAIVRVCSSIQLQLGIATHIHTCTNETHSLAPLQDLIPTLATNIQTNTSCSQSIGIIKSCISHPW